MSKFSRYFRDLNARFAHRDIVVTGEPPFRMATFTSDQVIGRTIREKGQWQETRIMDVVKWLNRPIHERIFLDVGANIGTHSITALNNGFAKAVCVEPEPNNFMLLKINQILNGVDGKCLNLNVAASLLEGHLEFALNSTNPGDHRILVNSNTADSTPAASKLRTISVPTIPLDALLHKNKIAFDDIGLVWIDTQGHEGHVLSSASALLGAGIPVVIEFWPYGLKQANGYELLRPILEHHKIVDANKLPQNSDTLSIENIDRLYQGWESEHAPHTDFLLLPKG